MDTRIDDMSPTGLASRAHELPAMKNGISVKLSVGQILDLLIDGAPESLDTLNEIAAALADDQNFASAVLAAIAQKADATALAAKLALAGGTMAGNVDYANFAINNPSGSWLRGYISPNANLANNATDAVNDIDFPAMIVASDEATPIIINHAAATAQLDVAFGTGNGGRFDSAISDGTWHCFVISNGTTVARGFSKSLNPTGQPNYPSGYTHYRRVGSQAIRVSGSFLGFSQNEDEVLWLSPKDNTNVSNPGNTGTLIALTVPIGIKTTVLANAYLRGGSQAVYVLFSSPDQTDIVPSGVDNFSAYGPTFASGVVGPATVRERTDTSGRIRYRFDASDANTFIRISTKGYVDTRGRT